MAATTAAYLKADFYGKAAVYTKYSAAFFNLYLKGISDGQGTLDGTGSAMPFLADFHRRV